MTVQTRVRKVRPALRLQVARTERLTPHLIRVVFGGSAVRDFTENGYTDAYVKLVFPLADVDYPEPFDLAEIRAQLPATQWPKTRTYTVRSFDRQASELAIDFVYHGDEGLAGPWAASAEPGDFLLVSGPGGAYSPRDDVDWHLLVGDESALPAISATLEAMPAGIPVKALIQIAAPSEELALATKADVDVKWLSRTGGDADLVTAVRGLEFPNGTVQAFVHGEAGFVRPLRRHLLDERGIPKELLSISGYWRKGADEDGWQAEKRAEKALELNRS